MRELTVAAAVDFKSFYGQRQRPAGEKDDVLVLSCDGKGVVMRPEALRAATQKQSQSSNAKLSTRLSKGEKRGRQRMAEVCAVYEVTPAERSAADILPADEHERQAAQPAPMAKHKWLSASVTEDASSIVADMFLIDVIHVIEYQHCRGRRCRPLHRGAMRKPGHRRGTSRPTAISAPLLADRLIPVSDSVGPPVGESQGRALPRREPCSSLDALLLQSRTGDANRPHA